MTKNGKHLASAFIVSLFVLAMYAVYFHTFGCYCRLMLSVEDEEMLSNERVKRIFFLEYNVSAEEYKPGEAWGCYTPL